MSGIDNLYFLIGKKSLPGIGGKLSLNDICSRIDTNSKR
jgi:hypothetical protein